jgi:hypothetical protein
MKHRSALSLLLASMSVATSAWAYDPADLTRLQGGDRALARAACGNSFCRAAVPARSHCGVASMPAGPP